MGLQPRVKITSTINRPRSRRFLGVLSISLIIAIGMQSGFCWRSLSTPEPQLYPSQYASTVTAPFNQPDYYPIALKPSANYRPVSEWVGRLLLPTVAQYQQVPSETDWAWLEVEVAPASASQLVGQTVRLAWQPTPLAQAYVNKASRDVRFPPSVQKTLEQGILHPVRLNGRDRVGPLQSLAGGHPLDDVTVALRGTVTLEQKPGAKPTLRVEREPTQETGRYLGLVKFIEPVATSELPTEIEVESLRASSRRMKTSVKL